jgi:hypothetical protein
LIPLPQILAELVMALGGALFAASTYALLRPYLRPNAPGSTRPQARGRVLINAFIGLVVLVWGFASFISR